MMPFLIERPVTEMSEVIFDAHAFVKRLTAVGFTEEQAEVFANEQVRLIEDRLATKRDLKELEEQLTYRLTLRLGSMLVVAISIVATLVKIL